MEYTQAEKEALFEQEKTGIYTSEHYVFHFLSGSLAEKEIATIAQGQEESFSRICATLQIPFAEKIHYYFTDSPLEIGRIFWEEGTSCNGIALCGDNKIYAVYSENIKCIGSHEDTHLISFVINYPESDFIVEGLAMFMDGLWWSVPNEVWAAYYKKRFPELSVLGLLANDTFAECGCQITYPIAGAFTKYLVDTFGTEKYLEFYKYKGCDYKDTFLSIFSNSADKTESQFWIQMSSVAFDAEELEAMLQAEGF